MPRSYPPLEERFWAKVEKTEGCWNWVGARNAQGYGHFRLNGWIQKAHRVSLMLAGRPVPNDLTVDHLCLNKSCVRPNHLEIVTAGENSLRGGNPPAQNARKTHCMRGHELAPDNLIKTNTRSRWCRTCHNERSRRARAAARDARAAA
jgi:hypothetical protein